MKEIIQFLSPLLVRGIIDLTEEKEFSKLINREPTNPVVQIVDDQISKDKIIVSKKKLIPDYNSFQIEIDGYHIIFPRVEPMKIKTVKGNSGTFRIEKIRQKELEEHGEILYAVEHLTNGKSIIETSIGNSFIIKKEKILGVQINDAIYWSDNTIWNYQI